MPGPRLAGRSTKADLFTREQWSLLGERWGLSAREQDVARLLCRSYSKKVIARRLGVSPNTVRMHCRRIFAKLGVHDRVAVAVRLVLTSRVLSGRPCESSGECPHRAAATGFGSPSRLPAVPCGNSDTPERA